MYITFTFLSSRLLIFYLKKITKLILGMQNMSSKKYLYKRTITSKYRMRMTKMETDIIMKSHEIVPSTSASTSFSENVIQSENIHDNHIVQTEFKNNVFNDDIVDNEIENVSCGEDLSNKYEFSDENARVIQDHINNVTENDNIYV